MAKLLIILFYFTIPLQVTAQIFPKEGSKLNYRIVGFSFAQLPKTNDYKIEIAKGNYNTADAFKKNIIKSASSKSTRAVIEVPVFGSEYTWQVVYNIKHKTAKTPLYHFSTLMSPHVDTSIQHLRILQQAAAQCRDYYVAVDVSGVLYDMTGVPVWFIPDTNGIGGDVADLEFTPGGTITFLYRTPFEINYNADILWKTSDNGILSGDTARGEFYHHQFTKLSTGHYMAMGLQRKWCKQVTAKDSSYIIFSDNGKMQDGYKEARFGTLIEYNEKGDIAWSWLSAKYLPGTDFDYFNPPDTTARFDPHENAFYFDEKNKCIYLGFRNLSRVMKIEYPGGRILRTYGQNFKPGASQAGAGLFCNQHSIGRTTDGYLYVFNNNSCALTDSLPAVVMLLEPESATDTFKKIWEYTCTIDGYFPEGNQKIFPSGGNAIELADSSLFVNMGAEYSKVFIVNRQKKVLWSALPEKLEGGNKWIPTHQHRAAILSRKDLERLIWNAEAPVAAME